jgi:hypothetical protein
VLAVWAVEQQRSADVVRGLAGGIFHLSCPKLFRVRGQSAAQVWRRHSRKRPDMSYSAGWMSRAEGALSTDV